jgi:hypothetical protein
MNRSGSTAPFIKGDAEPAVDIVVYFKVAVAELPGTYPFFRGPCFGSCTVFVGTADIESLVTTESAKSGKDIGGKNLDQVPQMGNVVYIGKRGSNKSSFQEGLLCSAGFSL